MHVVHITSHFASLDYPEVIRGRAIRSLFATRVSHRCNRPRVDHAIRAIKIAAPMMIDAARRLSGDVMRITSPRS